MNGQALRFKKPSTRVNIGTGSNDSIASPKIGLPNTWANLEVAIDEFETRTEELPLTNGELAASNEESQNTSKRLYAVNAKLKNHVRHLDATIKTLREAVAERERAEANARQAVERRDQFLAMLSHELRNPLGAIVHASHMLRRDNIDQREIEKAQDVILRQGNQMSQLLSDLLDVSRVSQGKMHVCMDVVDVASTVQDVVSTVRTVINTRDQQLHVAVPDDPLWVRGTAARLKQIQINLLDNASKYTPPGESVWLTLTREDNDAVISVRDRGAGIPKAMLDVIFDLFVQSETTLDSADGGMGVGLALVRSLVEIHRGSIEARSNGEGRGSEFVVRLPLADEPRRLPNDTPPPDRRASGELRIVIVEDNIDSRRMLSSLLRFDGCHVEVAGTGPEGAALIFSEQPDVAFVDIGLPGMDGYCVARAVRDALGSSVYLVALTGYGQDSDRRAAFDAGFDEHLVKPVQPDALSKVLSINFPK